MAYNKFEANAIKKQDEAYKAAGVDEFIHVKTNVLESLTSFQKMMNLI